MELLDHYHNLAAEDHSLRLQAIRSISQAIKEACDADTLYEICQKVDERHVEHATPEVFFLRAEWADRCKSLGLIRPKLISVLLRYVQDRQHDTYPSPEFDVQGPEWPAPSKWKVRISSAYALGVLGDRACLPVLLQVFEQETVAPARTAIALAIAAVSCSGSEALDAYLKAADMGNKDLALGALSKIHRSGNAEIDRELSRLRLKIRKH